MVQDRTGERTTRPFHLRVLVAKRNGHRSWHRASGTESGLQESGRPYLSFLDGDIGFFGGGIDDVVAFAVTSRVGAENQSPRMLTLQLDEDL